MELVQGAAAVNPAWKIRGWPLKEKLDREREEERLGTRTGPTFADAWIGRSGSDQQRTRAREVEREEGGQGPPPEIDKGRGRQRGPAPGRKVRSGAGVIVLAFLFCYYPAF